MYARSKGWELGDVTVRADFDNRSTPRRCVIAVELDAALTDEQLIRLERVARACPVRRSLGGGVEFQETLHAPHASSVAERGAP